jgi:hypothetical protein
MKIITGLIALFTLSNCFGQTTSGMHHAVAIPKDTSSPGVIFFEDFNDNKNNWTVTDNKNQSSRIDSGFYYLAAVGHAFGEAQEVKIDTRKNFEIETRIKILSGNSDHKNYYSMLFWGREAMNGYYFTFAKDGFASVELCNGKNQGDCITKNGSLQKTMLNPDGFNVYMIRKTGNSYSFFVNGRQFYEMPFAPFFGNLIGFGAGRKVSLVIDYLRIVYL